MDKSNNKRKPKINKHKSVSKRQRYISIALIIVIIFTLTLGVTAFADGNDDLSAILDTKAFRGNLEIIKNFTWVGTIIQWFISVFGFFGIVAVLARRGITSVYIGGRPLFNMIDEVKNEGGGQWTKENFSKLKTGKYGKVSGVDSLINFVLGFMPNVKSWSDYNPDVDEYNLSDTDTITNYWLKTLVPTIMLLTFYSSMWNGSLIGIYMSFAKGLGAVAEQVADIQWDKYVTDLLTSGDNYQFTLNVSNKPGASKRQAIASSIYSDIIRKYEIKDTATKQIVGVKVENFVKEQFSDMGRVKDNYKGQSADGSWDYEGVTEEGFWKAFRYNTAITSANDTTGALARSVKELYPACPDDNKIIVQGYLKNLDRDSIFTSNSGGGSTGSESPTN